jgi:hypothetical protein
MKLNSMQLIELAKIGTENIYITDNNCLRVSVGGIIDIIKAYEKMKYEHQLEQSELNLKPQTLTSLWGLMKDRTCTNSCSVVCGECQLPISSQTEIVNESWEGCDGCTEQDEVMYKNGYAKGYNAAISELSKEISDEEIEKEAEKRSKSFNGFTTYEKSAWVMACKWYREQLKQNL